MSDFYDQIVKDVEKVEVVEQIRREPLPIYIWGCGEIAHILSDYFEKQDIQIEGMVVDSEYKVGEECKQDVITFDDLESKKIKYSLVIGHAHYEKMELIRKKYPNIHRIFYFTSICYQQYNPISLEFYHMHKELYYQTYQILEDNLSKKCMVAYLNTRISDDIKYVMDSFQGEQNYFNNDIFKISEAEVYVDVGAYDGDTIKTFLKESGRKYSRIVAIEPNKENFKRLQMIKKEEQLSNIELFCCGTWSNNTTLYSLGIEQNYTICEQKHGKEKITVFTLDGILDGCDVTMIKINFLNGVKETLLGAVNTIKRNVPKMAVAVGFDEWAIINIPQILKRINPQYKLYLRFNSAIPAKLILYAMVNK